MSSRPQQCRCSATPPLPPSTHDALRPSLLAAACPSLGELEGFLRRLGGIGRAAPSAASATTAEEERRKEVVGERRRVEGEAAAAAARGVVVILPAGRKRGSSVAFFFEAADGQIDGVGHY